MKILIVHLILVAAMGAPATADTVSEIAAAGEKRDEDFNSGDAARMFRAFLQAGFSDETSTIENLEIVPDDTAIEVFWDEVSRTTKSGEMHREFDKNLRVWRRGGDGIRRVHRWSFSSLPN
ncbi:hypothetical protein LNKW23_43200 [Paralimibaculum aggregatum]|uniref:Nuclear transport factor 2 family protein n=1 Tax=Paralimibaculum aggregatum TaxID=3036245 RepID=A0ABQ6LSP2_9RHOB|nr:hypothetical protein [Limibaculum sp. NKW23]GMG85104.1 hypothetical protein LNKW23_43200 [Limibaculum sp. NKW23]